MCNTIDMNVAYTSGQMRRGLLEFSVLLIVSKCEVYASDIIENLKDHNLLIVEGTLYPLLNRLTRLGYLSYDWQESETGPPRKYYSLTKEGEKVLERMIKEWKDLSVSINNLID